MSSNTAQQPLTTDYKPMNAVYFANWSPYTGQSPAVCIRPQSVTHVFYAFALINPNGTLKWSDEWVDLQKDVDGCKGGIRAMMALKSQNPALKVLLSLGGGGAGSAPFAAVASDATLRKTLADSALKVCRDFGFNGIDLDWEHPETTEQGDNYVRLLRTLRETLPQSEGYLLTSAVPAGEWALRTMQMAQAGQYLDFVNLMAYDFTGPWVQTADYHGRLYSNSDQKQEVAYNNTSDQKQEVAYNNTSDQKQEVAYNSGHTGVTYLLNQGIPARKIVLGVPAYGRGFFGAAKIGDTHDRRPEVVYPYRELCVDPASASAVVDQDAVGVSRARPADGGGSELITYDSLQTVAMKAAYVRQKNLGGLFYWTAHMDDYTASERSLVQRGFDELRRVN